MEDSRFEMIVSDHTILGPVTAGMNVLDVGSRNYGFSCPMAELGCKVVAIEPDDDVSFPAKPGIHRIFGALVARGHPFCQDLFKWSSGEGNFLEYSCIAQPPKSATRQRTCCYSIQEIMKMAAVDYWDIVKLDCEGTEYAILLDWPGPIAGQITVEFHDFTGANPEGEETYNEIFAHLGRWYDVVQHKASVRFAANVNNYWDSLFVLREKAIT